MEERVQIFTHVSHQALRLCLLFLIIFSISLSLPSPLSSIFSNQVRSRRYLSLPLSPIFTSRNVGLSFLLFFIFLSLSSILGIFPSPIEGRGAIRRSQTYSRLKLFRGGFRKDMKHVKRRRKERPGFGTCQNSSKRKGEGETIKDPFPPVDDATTIGILPYILV